MEKVDKCGCDSSFIFVIKNDGKLYAAIAAAHLAVAVVAEVVIQIIGR